MLICGLRAPRRPLLQFCSVPLEAVSVKLLGQFEHRKWNRGRNGLHQLGQPVAPSILFPVFKSEGEPGTPYPLVITKHTSTEVSDEALSC